MPMSYFGREFKIKPSCPVKDKQIVNWRLSSSSLGNQIKRRVL